MQVGVGERMVELGVRETALVVRPRERRERLFTPRELKQARPHPATTGLAFAQAAILPEPAITDSSSSTRIGTERWPESRSISARSRAREGQVQGMPVPPLTVRCS